MPNHPFHNLRGEQKDQLLQLVDKRGNIIGTATREECHKGKGKTHLAFLAFIFDNSGKVILTKRSKQKSLWGNFWDASVVSHVLPTETVIQAANRRGKEELGVDVQFKDLGAFYYFIKHGESAENEYCHVLVGKTHEYASANPIEVSEIMHTSREKLKLLVEKNPEFYTPWLKIALFKFDSKLILK